MYNASNSSPNSSTAISVQDLFNVWVNALTKPNVPTYQQEATRGSQNAILLNAGVGIGVVLVFSLLGGLIGGNILSGLFIGLITSALNLAINMGALYVAAKLTNGNGSLEQQAWVQSTYLVPLMIISNIPLVGWIVGWIGSLYSIYLTYITVQAVHRLPSDKAIITTLIWLAINFVVGLLIVTAVVAAIAAALFAAGAVTS